MTLYADHMQNLDLRWECLLGLWCMQRNVTPISHSTITLQVPLFFTFRPRLYTNYWSWRYVQPTRKIWSSMTTLTWRMVAPKNSHISDRTITLQVPLFITFILRLYWGIYSPGHEQSLCKRSRLHDETTICYDFLKIKTFILLHPISRSICRPFFFDFIYDSLCL